MDTQLIKTKFESMGARLKFSAIEPLRWTRQSKLPFRVDVQRDSQGEAFVLQVRPGADLDVGVADVQPQRRHLVLLVRSDGRREYDRFLCGHDERSWFVAAVPQGGTVTQAIEALKPPEVRAAQDSAGVRTRDRQKRRTAAYIRQGEWFFLPAPGLTVDEWLVLRNEPLRRGAGKPHVAEFACRLNGTTVYVCQRYPNGLETADYKRLLKAHPEASKWSWAVMLRDSTVYVRGRIRHPDHKTIVLKSWHRVLMNTETRTRSMANVAFLD